MIDKTTEGYSAEPDEVEAVLHNLCGYLLQERDAVVRYQVLTREQVLYTALVATIRRERGRALAEIAAGGRTLTEVADLTRLGNRQRVQRLIGVFRTAAEALQLELPAPAPQPVPEPPAVWVPAQRGPSDADLLPEPAEPPVLTEAVQPQWPDFFAEIEPDDATGEAGSWWRRRRTGAA